MEKLEKFKRFMSSLKPFYWKTVVNKDLTTEKQLLLNHRFFVPFLFFCALLFFWDAAVLTYRYIKINKLENAIRKYEFKMDSLIIFNSELEDQIEIDNLYYSYGKYSIEDCKDEPTQADIYNLAVECGAWYPEFIAIQAQMESGSGKSDLAKNANNLYGMKKVWSRKLNCQLPNGDYHGYGLYANWKLSVICRIMLDHEIFKSKPSRREYEDWIYSRYAEDPFYRDKVTELMKQYKYE